MFIMPISDCGWDKTFVIVSYHRLDKLNIHVADRNRLWKWQLTLVNVLFVLVPSITALWIITVCVNKASFYHLLKRQKCTPHSLKISCPVKCVSMHTYTYTYRHIPQLYLFKTYTQVSFGNNSYQLFNRILLEKMKCMEKTLLEGQYSCISHILHEQCLTRPATVLTLCCFFLQ